MVQRKVLVRGATNQALDELDVADLPDLSASFEVAGAVAAHAGDGTGVHGITDTADLIVEGDARLTDARTPTAHAASHNGGGDGVTPAGIGADVVGAAAAAQAASQPLDSDLTAIAALTTTAFGRSFLDRADAAAARTILALGTAALSASGDFDPAGSAADAQAASQPLDSDLTTIAALTTTAYGRAFLALADAAAGRTALGLGTAAVAASGDFDASGAAAAAQAASQPVDSDLTAIAALTTTAFGRSLLALADAAALAAAHTHPGANPWTAVIKTADESKNSLATVADDALLVATLLANTSYVLKLRAFFLTVTAADLKYRLVFTGTTTRVRRRIFRTATTDIAQTIELKTAFDVADVVLCTTGLNPWFEEDVILQVGASGGVFKLQWAQVTSNGGPTTCLEGSYLEYAVT